MKNTTNKLPTYTFSSFTESMTIKAFKLKQHFEPEMLFSVLLKSKYTLQPVVKSGHLAKLVACIPAGRANATEIR